MVGRNHIQSVSTNIGIVHSMTVLFLLFSTFVCSIPAIGPAKVDNSGLVYCPLQKKWVKSAPPVVVESEPLAEICAPNESKLDFFSTLAQVPLLKSSRLNGADNEVAFFEFVTDGKDGIVALNKTGNLPGQEIARAARVAKAHAASYRHDPERDQSLPYFARLFPRPPTAAASVLYFRFAFVTDLEKISRSINPRSPPRLS